HTTVEVRVEGFVRAHGAVLQLDAARRVVLGDGVAGVGIDDVGEVRIQREGHAAEIDDVHLLAARCADHVDSGRITRVRLQNRRLGITVDARGEHVGIVWPRVGVPTLSRLVVDQSRAADARGIGHVAGTDLRIRLPQHQAEVAVALAVGRVDVDLGTDVLRLAADRVGEGGTGWRGDQRTVEAVASRVGASGAQRRAAAEAGDGRATNLVRVDEVAIDTGGARGDTLLGRVASVDTRGLRVAD